MPTPGRPAGSVQGRSRRRRRRVPAKAPLPPQPYARQFADRFDYEAGTLTGSGQWIADVNGVLVPLIIAEPGSVTTIGTSTCGNSVAGTDDGAEIPQAWTIAAEVTLHRTALTGCQFRIWLGDPAAVGNDDKTGLKILHLGTGLDHFRAFVGEEGLSQTFDITLPLDQRLYFQARCDGGIVTATVNGRLIGISQDQTSSIPASSAIIIEAQASAGNLVTFHNVYRGTQE